MSWDPWAETRSSAGRPAFISSLGGGAATVVVEEYELAVGESFWRAKFALRNQPWWVASRFSDLEEAKAFAEKHRDDPRYYKR